MWPKQDSGQIPDWTTGILPGRPTGDEATRKFLDGRAVILLGSLEQLAYIKKNANFKLGVDLPTGDLFWYGSDLVLLDRKSTAKDTVTAAKRTTRRQELCQNFLELLYRPNSRLSIFKATPSLPVLRAENNSQELQNDLTSGILVKTAMSRKMRSLGLDKIAPQARQEWGSQVWNALEQGANSTVLGSKVIELRQSLQKLLSTNSR